MKKLFLSLVAVLMAATATYAQNTLVATLSHGEDITMYYGYYALRDAMNAAVSSDVINLSGGSFQATDITKAITLRGTGIDDAAPTYISGEFTINIPSDDANRLSMEGIRFVNSVNFSGTFNNPFITKCTFTTIYTGSNANIKNIMFANCKITREVYNDELTSMQFINSYIADFENYHNNASAAFVNCVIGAKYPDYMANSQLLNCIIYYSWSSTPLPASASATNCLSIGFNDLFSNNSSNTGNTSLSSSQYASVFKDFTGTYSDSQTFELTDEAATTYLGTDGTQVGMYGGILPYTSTPSYPQITKMNVANKTTADGKLSVEIEVSAAE